MPLLADMLPDLTLLAKTPFDGAGVLRFLGSRTIAGIDRVEGSSYARVCAAGGRVGSFVAEVLDGGVGVTISETMEREASFISSRIRTIFDLDADPEAIGAHLAKDPLLRKLVRRRPGVRIAGAWNPFEVCVRAIVGQQVSVAAASTIVGRVVETFGRRVETAGGELGFLFPEPEALAEARTENLGMPGRRCETIRVLARKIAEKAIALDRMQALEKTVGELIALPGIGRWTAEYIALRGLSHPDAFPAGDLGLRKAAGGGVPVPERELARRAETWRPYRGYAAMLLWGSLT